MDVLNNNLNTTKDITQFKGYNKVLAECHINNWGVVYLDEYKQPLEVEEVVYMLEDLNE